MESGPTPTTPSQTPPVRQEVLPDGAGTGEEGPYNRGMQPLRPPLTSSTSTTRPSHTPRTPPPPSHPTTHLPPTAYASGAPWFHRTNTNPAVAWDQEHKPEWLFTNTPTRPTPDPDRIAIGYSMYEPGRTGKHQQPYYHCYQLCHTPEKLTQTLTCRNVTPNTAYILHYIYSYLRQGQQEEELIAVSPRAKRIISKGLGVYSTSILQLTTPVAHLTTDLAIYAYLPMNACRPPQPSPANLIFFTDALRRVCPHTHHRGSHSATTPHRETVSHGPPHRPHHLRGLLTRGTEGHGRHHYQTTC